MVWRMLLIILIAGDKTAARWPDLSARWFDRYIRQELQNGKRPWRYHSSKLYW